MEVWEAKLRNIKQKPKFFLMFIYKAVWLKNEFKFYGTFCSNFNTPIFLPFANFNTDGFHGFLSS